jgi:catechol 2,3-dioxygenase-like lactoylglutathione lyase family enzyme
MEQRVSVVTLGVADLDRSRLFYEDGLGWRRGNSGDEIVFFQANGMIVALFPWDHLAADAQVSAAGEGFRGVTVAYCTRSREEVDAVLAQAEQAGGRIMKPAQDVFWGGYSGYFADPDGHLWEVAWNPDWTMDGDGNVSLKRPDHE